MNIEQLIAAQEEIRNINRERRTDTCPFDHTCVSGFHSNGMPCTDENGLVFWPDEGSN